MKISVDIHEDKLEGDYGGWVDGLVLSSSRCGHRVQVFGTEINSALRGAIMLREECPNGENNFYDVEHWRTYPSHLIPKP